MSTMTQLPPTPTDDEPTGGRPGSLFRAELHRFRARRFLQVLLGVSVLGWAAATVIALTQFGNPTDADVADARAEIDRIVADSEMWREQCLDDPEQATGGSLPPGLTPEEICGPPLRVQDLPIDDFISKAPFDLAASGIDGALGFAAAAAIVAFLVGATWIGAEWSSRSLVALLFWVPRRVAVMGTKFVVLLLGAAVFGVLAQAGWLVTAGILRATVGTDDPLPDGFWAELLSTQGRSVLLTTLVAALGFGLANLIRNTGAALGVGFVYFAVLENAIRALRPSWQPWLLSNNAGALLAPGGLEIPDYRNLTVGSDGFGEPTIYVIGNVQAGVVLTIATAVVVGLGVVLFTRRDIH